MMNLFPWFKKKEFFSSAEKQQILEAIQNAERTTSGEVRIFIESKCRFVDASDRAREIFLKLKMTETAERNATLIYIAVKDKQAAVFGDEGIYAQVPASYWSEQVNKMLVLFRQEKLAEGICEAIRGLGQALRYYFPYDAATDKNELPDDIIFGT